MELLIILTLFVAWIIYEYSYYKGEKFTQLKSSLNDYTINCNALNEHIEELKQTYSNAKKTNYGHASLNDSSRYRFKRTHQVNAQKSEYTRMLRNCMQKCRNATV